MTYRVRPMHQEDVAQVADIDREAFPTLWPPANYQHELHSALSRYIVAYDEDKTTNNPGELPARPQNGVLARIRRLLNPNRSLETGLPPSDKQYLVGFTGLWITADEVHITNIAVREAYHRRGIGELLIIATIDLAVKLKARTITLEVRSSNTAAQALYRKHGFNQVGLRPGYYRDDKEDAILMSTEEIGSASFQSQFQQLKQAHFKRLGITSNHVSR